MEIITKNLQDLKPRIQRAEKIQSELSNKIGNIQNTVADAWINGYKEYPGMVKQLHEMRTKFLSMVSPSERQELINKGL
jgi:dsDNA-specific endonuclease/ATPase MutS2